MEKFNKESLPRKTKYFEKILEKNSKDEVYCVGNKASGSALKRSQPWRLSTLFRDHFYP